MVRTLLLVVEPVADYVVTFLTVVAFMLSPTVIKLYTCHMSSGSSGVMVMEPWESFSMFLWCSFILLIKHEHEGKFVFQLLKINDLILRKYFTRYDLV